MFLLLVSHVQAFPGMFAYSVKLPFHPARHDFLLSSPT